MSCDSKLSACFSVCMSDLLFCVFSSVRFTVSYIMYCPSAHLIRHVEMGITSHPGMFQTSGNYVGAFAHIMWHLTSRMKPHPPVAPPLNLCSHTVKERCLLKKAM